MPMSGASIQVSGVALPVPVPQAQVSEAEGLEAWDGMEG